MRFQGRRFRIAVALLLALLSAPLATPLAAQEQALSLEAYWQLVEETRLAVEDALAGDADAARALQDLGARWQAVDQVLLPGGANMAVEHDLLSAELTNAEPDLELLRSRLQAAEELHDQWPAPLYDAAEARAAIAGLNEILSRPAFQVQEEQPSLLDRIWQRVLRFLIDLIPEEIGDNAFLNYLITGLGLLLLLGVLFFVARTFLRSVSETAEADQDDPFAAPMSSQAALQEAESLSRGGDYRTAVRYLYLSTLLLLDERNLLRYDRTQTNREYLKRLADHPELSETLRSIVDVFDRVWYGHHALDQSAYARYEAQVRKIQERR
jgi:hypothetical protein